MPLEGLLLAQGKCVPEEGEYRSAYLLPELDDRGGGVLTGHIEG